MIQQTNHVGGVGLHAVARGGLFGVAPATKVGGYHAALTRYAPGQSVEGPVVRGYAVKRDYRIGGDVSRHPGGEIHLAGDTLRMEWRRGAVHGSDGSARSGTASA